MNKKFLSYFIFIESHVRFHCIVLKIQYNRLITRFIPFIILIFVFFQDKIISFLKLLSQFYKNKLEMNFKPRNRQLNLDELQQGWRNDFILGQAHRFSLIQNANFLKKLLIRPLILDQARAWVPYWFSAVPELQLRLV